MRLPSRHHNRKRYGGDPPVEMSRISYAETRSLASMVCWMRELEHAIVHAAVFDARRFLRNGYSLAAAVDAACPGAWRSYRRYVYQALICEQPDRSVEQRPKTNPAGQSGDNRVKITEH
jgi:hypothetical protein